MTNEFEAMHWKMRAMINNGWLHEAESFAIFRKKQFYKKYANIKKTQKLPNNLEDWKIFFKNNFDCFFSESTPATAKKIFKTYLVNRELEESLFNYKVIDIETEMLDIFKTDRPLNGQVMLPYFALQDARSINNILGVLKKLSQEAGLDNLTDSDLLEIKIFYNQTYEDLFIKKLIFYQTAKTKAFRCNIENQINSKIKGKNLIFLNDINLFNLANLNLYFEKEDLEEFLPLDLKNIEADITRSNQIIFLVNNYDPNKHLLYHKLFKLVVGVINSIIIQNAYDCIILSKYAKDYLIEQLFILHTSNQLNLFYKENIIYEKFEEINNRLHMLNK